MSGRNIPFFNYPAVFAQHETELMALIHDVLRRGAYIMQRDLSDFEHELALYLGVRHAIGVSDGTVALILALKAAGLPSGAEVIVPSHTFVASAAAIHHAGGKPVLADCGPDHLIDADSVRRLVSERTWGIMPVQLNGRTCDMDAIGSIARSSGLVVVEDACQALGSKFRGRYAGTFGAAGAFSFYPSKTLGCFGDGGAIVTDDDRVAERIHLLRDHGRADTGDVVTFGYNSRLDNLQAAVLGFKLKCYGDAIECRRELARRYRGGLHGVTQIVLPPGPDGDSDHFDIFQNYEIEADRRDELRAWLEAQGVRTILQWGGKMIHQFPALGLESPLPVTDRVSSRFLLLPLHTALSIDEVDYICEQIRAFYKRG